MATQNSQATGLSLLVTWANQQDHWVRALVAEIIDSRKGIGDEQVKHFYDLLLLEKELKQGESPSVPTLNTDGNANEQEDAFAIVKLSDVERVNALAPEQTIDFNPRLTVLFGENASGKSGYVRILKSIASVRTVEPILPDIGKPATDGGPSAQLTYRLGESEDTVEWSGESGLPPFTRTDIFDTRGLLLHVDQELTYVYTPGDLSLFRLVHEGIEKIKQKLDEARREAVPKGNPFLPKFKREDPVYTKIESLGSSTDLAELTKLADVPEEEETGLDSLRDKVDALKSKSTDARVQVAATERELFRTVSGALRIVRSFDCTAYTTAVTELSAAEKEHTRATKQAFAGEPIPGVLEKAWRQFIESAESYLQDIEAEVYPQADDTCIYCRQPLADSAVELVKKYRDFCNSRFKQKVDKARTVLDGLSADVRALDAERITTNLRKRAAADQAETESPPVLTKSLDFVAAAEQLRAAIEQQKAFDGEDLKAAATELRPVLATHLRELRSLIKHLTQQATERQKALEEESAKLRDLEARLTLRELIDQIVNHVESAKWADKANTIHARLSYTVGKSLTETSKVASEQLLNQNFEELFQRECEALRAPTVSLEFPGRKGQAARRKMLSPDHKLSDILSEGEQKVIALADFIAEASLRRKASPIVFDDPVNSLDYRRLDHVVARLVEMSSTRQVIVFTHNIWFATKLLSFFESNTDDCSYFDISESNGTFGVIARASHPRWDTFNKTKGTINRLIQDAEAATGPTQQALIETTYGYIRNITEVIVEQELFCGVTQRYTPHVAMTKLPNIKPDKLADAVNVIFPLYEKSCRIIEAHSQPLETLGIRPTLDELKADRDSLLAARDAYVKD